MSQFLGMNPEEVRALAVQFTNSAEQIRQLAGTLTTQLKNVPWSGPDQVRFQGDWDGAHLPNLNTVATALDDAARLANQNAVEQDQASH
jgi:uncharacterized protein YukE